MKHRLGPVFRGYQPTPEEIEAGTALIRAGWSDEERRSRRVGWRDWVVPLCDGGGGGDPRWKTDEAEGRDA